MQKHIVVTGATGNIGSRLAHELLRRGHRVTAVARSAAHLEALRQAGAEVRPGQLSDVAFLSEVLRSADAAFLMLPPNVTAPDNLAYQDDLGQAVTEAVRAAGLPQAVNLSSIAADLPAGTGPIVGVHRQEQRLNAIEGLRVVHLRPAYFMENFLPNIGLILGMGINGSATRPEVAFPMIATQDIADRAAALLDGPELPAGHTAQLLLGPRNYSMQEATALLGAAVGRPELPYVPFSYEQARQGMVGAGLSESMADLYIEMTQTLNAEKAMVHEVRTPDNTTPTTLEQFAQQVFAPAYQAAAGAAQPVA
ncbi:SDR family NAD(P)-dependent oxidoreductase [Hymenobacter oligotrophus]|uniref:SDR family NAD(P)-dependent oxidoreductase n=1 Tax=Hymenobacter oligotrophus TaxID=2319843 RepID=A0A3B7R2B3_9BACT|nr:SDR family NAD(P)-dependent oxidoreductase [Hymenobacter oligotrophus]AYA38155.1 SDR family NAD(P)-dependent oxidoreductase [Hymenobacter oligotrophus]